MTLINKTKKKYSKIKNNHNKILKKYNKNIIKLNKNSEIKTWTLNNKSKNINSSPINSIKLKKWNKG
jgi:hypothetical protein